MMDDEQVLGEAAHDFLSDLRSRLGHDLFYVYRTGGAGSGTGGQNKRRRTLLAFPSGDAALSFAQRNRLGPTPRLLRLSLPRLLTAMLTHPNIEAVLFAGEIHDDLPPGRLPEGLRFERTVLLEALQHSEI